MFEQMLIGVGLYVLGVLTILGKKYFDKLVIQTHEPVLKKSLKESINYSKQLLGIDIHNLQQLKVEDQDRFLGHALGYMRMNYMKTLKELNINDGDNDIMCSLIIGNIDSNKKEQETNGFIKQN